MKKVITLAAIVLTSITLNASAAMGPSLEKKLIAVCKTGLSDNLYKFSRTIHENKINKRKVFPNLVCNGESFHQFALSNGATEVASKIAPFSPKTAFISNITFNDVTTNQYSVNF